MATLQDQMSFYPSFSILVGSSLWCNSFRQLPRLARRTVSVSSSDRASGATCSATRNTFRPTKFQYPRRIEPLVQHEEQHTIYNLEIRFQYPRRIEPLVQPRPRCETP